MRLYEIDAAITNVYENAMDPETGEVVDEELFASLDGLLMEREKKIGNIACWYKDLLGDAAKIKAEEAALYRRRKALEAKAERLARWLGRALDGQNFEDERSAVRFRRATACVVDEGAEKVLAPEYLSYGDPKPNKKAITDALKDGKEVPGCRLEEHLSMKVY